MIIAEIFSEVIGVLSQSHFKLVQKKFFNLLNEFRKETPLISSTVRNIVSLLMGMKFFRIKVFFYILFIKEIFRRIKLQILKWEWNF